MRNNRVFLDFGLSKEAGIQISINCGLLVYGPYCLNSYPWNYIYPSSLVGAEVHYWAWSIDCSKIYTDVDGYEGQEFYSSKIFVDNELLYDTYFSKDIYDYLKNNQDTLGLRYFTLGRCSMSKAGYWHYADASVYTMRLYNRGLTEEEMLENYNVTRAYYSTISE